MSQNGKIVSNGLSRYTPNSTAVGPNEASDVEVLILALRTVSVAERQMFRLWYLNGEPEEQIATNYGMSLAEFRAARRRLHEKYRQLRSLLQMEQTADESEPCSGSALSAVAPCA